MKYAEPGTLEFAEKRRHIDYTQHRPVHTAQWPSLTSLTAGSDHSLTISSVHLLVVYNRQRRQGLKNEAGQKDAIFTEG